MSTAAHAEQGYTYPTKAGLEKCTPGQYEEAIRTAAAEGWRDRHSGTADRAIGSDDMPEDIVRAYLSGWRKADAIILAAQEQGKAS